MTEKPLDLRIQKTHKALIQSFLKLLEEKRFENIIYHLARPLNLSFPLLVGIKKPIKHKKYLREVRKAPSRR